MDAELQEAIELASEEIPADPFQPQTLAPDAIPFDFDADYSRFPALAPYKDLTWQYANIEEKDCLNPETNEWIFGEVWSSATVQEHPRKKGIFYFTLRNAKKKAKILVTPVVEEGNYESTLAIYEAIKRKQKERRLRILEARRKVQEAQERQRRISRAFAVNSLGIYNIDKIWDQPQLMVMADFRFDQFSGDVSQEDVAQVYLIMPEENAVVPILNTSGIASNIRPRQKTLSWPSFLEMRLPSSTMKTSTSKSPAGNLCVPDAENPANHRLSG